MIAEDEFICNEEFGIVRGSDPECGWDHIARHIDDKPLCGVRIKHADKFDLFGPYLCPRCEKKYNEIIDND